jgi:hypothetical protein
MPFDQAIADAICDRLAGGESLRRICSSEDMPAASSVFKWLAENVDFAEQYARAREAQADTLADEIVDIADDDSRDIEDHDGKEVYSAEAVARSRLRVDARKWVASKLKPKKYGDKLQHTGGDGEGPIQAAVSITFRKTDAADEHRTS